MTTSTSPYLTEEHRQLRETLRAYLDAHAPLEAVAAWDRNETFPEPLYAGLADLGVLGLTIPRAYGGEPGDEFSLCIVAEEMARVGAFLMWAYFPTVTFGARAVARFGTEEQRERILPEVASGAARMAIGLTEPDAGSDLAGLSTRADVSGDRLIINGQKVFTTGADISAYIVVLARTDPSATGSRGLSVVLVPTDVDGITIRPLRKLAGQATHTCEVFFASTTVARDALLGGEPLRDRGMHIVLELLDAERIYVAAQSVGLAQRALDWALDFAKQRVQFGKPIAQHQAVAHLLADAEVRVEAGRQLTYAAAWRLEHDLPCTRESAIAKIYATEAASGAIRDCMQVMGGYSYIEDYGIERLYRECKLHEIAGGTNQILRNVLGRALGIDVR